MKGAEAPMFRRREGERGLLEDEAIEESSVGVCRRERILETFLQGDEGVRRPYEKIRIYVGELIIFLLVS